MPEYNPVIEANGSITLQEFPAEYKSEAHKNGNIIIQDYQYFKLSSTDIELFLKLNKLLKDFGFSKVRFGDIPVDPQPKLTLIVRPGCYSYDYVIDAIWNESVKKYSNIESFACSRIREPSFLDFKETEKFFFKDTDPKQGHFGFWVKSSNIAIVYFPLYECQRPDTLKYYMELLERELKRVKIKEVKIDLEEIAMNKFMMALNQAIHNKQMSIDTSHNNILSYMQSVRLFVNEVATFNAELEGLLDYQKNFNTIFKKNLQEMKKLKFIKNLALDVEGIKFDIQDIIIKYGKDYYGLGDFTITIKPDNSFMVKGNNKGVPASGHTYWHPHVSDNSSCFGEHSITILNLIKDMKYKELAVLINMALHTYNHSDKFLAIEKFKDFIIKNPDKKKIEFKPIETFYDGEEPSDSDTEVLNDDVYLEEN
jgi:hypothetical protein